MIEAHAPGKLLICGEYAVLHGAPAIAVAMDVRARVRVTPAAQCRLVVPDVGAWPFDWGAGHAPHWREPPAPAWSAVLDAVAVTLASHGLAWRRVLEVTLDSRDFRRARADGGSDKLGLGSSAAITVALVAALVADMSGTAGTNPDLLTSLALDAHRQLQSGRGSGVDVAVAVRGGVLTLTGAGDAPVIRPLGWPAGLHAVAAWSGASAATPELLARFDTFARADPAHCQRGIGELRRIAVEALAAWERADVPVVLRALTDYDDALRALDDGGHVGIYTGAHQRLAREAQSAGAAYKISGAGGGDFGIAFADTAHIAAAVRARWAAKGILTLDIARSVPGVNVYDALLG